MPAEGKDKSTVAFPLLLVIISAILRGSDKKSVKFTNINKTILQYGFTSTAITNINSKYILC